MSNTIFTCQVPTYSIPEEHGASLQKILLCIEVSSCYIPHQQLSQCKFNLDCACTEVSVVEEQFLTLYYII